MKKILILIAASAMIFTSCKKYDLSDPVNINTFPKVSVTGVAKAEFDAVKGETPVPEGTILVFTMPNSSYLSGTQGNHVITTTTGANGEYTINIPVPTDGITATVSSSNFISTYTVTDNISYQKIYELSGITVTVNPNVNVIENLTFAGTEINPIDDENRIKPTAKSTLTGTLEYLSKTNEDFTLQYSTIPTGTEIRVKITLKEFDNPNSGLYEEYQTIKVGNGGKYSVEVPMIVDGKATVELKSAVNLEYTEYNSESQAVTKFYRYSLDQTVTVYEENISGKDFKYTQGVMVN